MVCPGLLDSNAVLKDACAFASHSVFGMRGGSLAVRSSVSRAPLRPAVRRLRVALPAVIASAEAPGGDGKQGETKSATTTTALAEQTLEQRLDPVAARVRAELAADGVNMDELMNAGKVVSLTRKLDAVNAELDGLDAAIVDAEKQRVELNVKADELRQKIMAEKRQVMQEWLKKVFLVQALVFVVVGGLLSNDAVPGFEVPLVGQALGFWTTWLFSIPALRARKGTAKWEKSALNAAFVITPVLNVAFPFATKNCGIIWGADVGVLASAYAWYAATGLSKEAEDDDGSRPKEQGRITGILKYLDWGSWR